MTVGAAKRASTWSTRQRRDDTCRHHRQRRPRDPRPRRRDPDRRAASQYTSFAPPLDSSTPASPPRSDLARSDLARSDLARSDLAIGPGKLDSGGTLVVGVAGTNGIPANAKAAILNIRSPNPTPAVSTTVYPTGARRRRRRPSTSKALARTRAALATVPLGSNGSVNVFSERGSQIIVDVVGFYGPRRQRRGALVPLTLSRLLDTRNGSGVSGGATAKVGANQTIELQVTARGGVPALDPANPTNVSAAIVNVTATQTTAPGFFTAFPGGTIQPTASTLNAPETDETIANLAVVKVGPAGTIQLFSEAGGHLIVDVVGYVTGNANALATQRGLFVPRSRRAASPTPASARVMPSPPTRSMSR